MYTGSAEPNEFQLVPNLIQGASYNRPESSALVVEIKNRILEMEPDETSKPRTEVTTMPEPTTLAVDWSNVPCVETTPRATSNQ